MKITSIRNYLLQKYELAMPTGDIPGTWFSHNDLPMVVACTCCGMTMALPSCWVDYDTDEVYCSTCTGAEED